MAGAAPFPSFAESLASHRLDLRRDLTATLQINVGSVCNLRCAHCHVAAGPERTEAMDEATVRQVAAYAARGGFAVADITGGAPEMNPHLPLLVELLAPAVRRIMVRTNLTLLADPARGPLVEELAARRVAMVASFPSLSAGQAEAQRGEGTFGRMLSGLRRLNEAGYGDPATGLELALVVNPAGAYLAPGQEATQRRFRTEMLRRWGIRFTRLFAFGNVPLGRFGGWLADRGDYDRYMARLAGSFNPAAVAGVMCRTQVSVDWRGYLYDCDFHLAAGLPVPDGPRHVSQMAAPPGPGSPIAVADHCYACTAGPGFTCGGAIEG